MNPTINASRDRAIAANKPFHFGSALDSYFVNDTSGSWTGTDPQAPPLNDLWLSGDLSPRYSAIFASLPPPAGVREPGASSPAVVALVSPSSSTVISLPFSASPTESAAAAATATASATLTQVLYLKEPGDSAAISVNDINQGQMGDCYLLSSIGEIALFDPGLITQMIQANTNGTEMVTLYRAANGSLPTIGTATYTPDAINVTNSFPSDSVNNGATQDVYDGQKEIWVQVLEKAVATLCGGYNDIANGGIPSISMEELTGCPAVSISPGAISLQQLQSDVAAGDLITFDTGGDGELAYGLYGDHAYMFESLSTVNGTVMVNLLNPWGFDDPNPIPFSQIGTVVDEIDIGQVSGRDPGPSLVQQTANQTWTQGSKVSLTIPAGTFSDGSGEKLTYTVTQANGQACPSWLSFNASTLTFSGTVPAGMETLSLTVTATDTSGLSCSETFAAVVPAAAPTLAHQTAAQTWTEGASLSFTLPSNTFADPNGEALSYSATLASLQALPSWLTINSTTGTLSGTAGYTSGPLSIKVTATDTSGLSVSELIQATLVAPAPKLTDQTASQTWTAGKALSFALASDTFTAVQGQTLKYTATLPAGLTINPTTGTISGTVPVVLGTYTITVTATETSGLAVSESFKATIVAAAPVVKQTAAQAWTANKGVSLSVASAFADPQGETLTYTAALSNGKALPAGLTFNAATGTFGGIAPAALGSLAITVTAKDQSGLSASETIQCTIAASAPVVNNQPTSQSWTANKAVTDTLPSNAFVDPQGETLTYAATMADGSALPSWLKFNATTGAFTGTAPVTPQTLAFTVTATDQSGLSSRETFQVAVQAAAPGVANQTGSLIWAAGKTVSVTLASNTFVDPQGEKMTLSATQANGSALPAGLTFNAATGTFSGTAPITPETLGLKVTATDASGLSTSETFSALIQAAAPTLAHPTANQFWTDGSTMSFLAAADTFADPQGAALTYAVYQISGPDQTNWLHSSVGLADFTGTVPAGLAGTIGIKIVATDAFGLSTSETFGLTFAAAGSHLSAANAPAATEMLALHG